MTERNNQDRSAPPQAPPQHPAQPNPEINPQGIPQNIAPQSGANLQFTVPTEFVDLPSKGKYYPPGHPLKGRESVEIKYMTAKEEDILASPTLIKKGIVFDRLIQSLVVDPPIKPDDLLIGDRNAILVAARITGYGKDYPTDVTCPACKKKGKFNFDLELASISTSVDDEMYNLASVQETENGTFNINIESINTLLEVRPLNGRDEKKLTSVASAKSRNNLADAPITDGMKSYIVSVNGIQDRAYINQFVDTLPARESRKIRVIYRNIIPKVSIKSLYSCANCGHEQELEVPLNIDFFWPDE